MTGHARDFEAMLSAMRPTLHRYCARMTGSAVDGEDVVQDAMMKALVARGSVGPLDNPEGWLFRIAHNAALDFLRRSRRTVHLGTEEELAMVAAPDRPDPDIATTSLRTFLRLPALQRSTVILKDVLGHSLAEISEIVGVTEPVLSPTWPLLDVRPAARAALQSAAVGKTLNIDIMSSVICIHV